MERRRMTPIAISLPSTMKCRIISPTHVFRSVCKYENVGNNVAKTTCLSILLFSSIQKACMATKMQIL